jgi:hypothetical protein
MRCTKGKTPGANDGAFAAQPGDSLTSATATTPSVT